jgi:hypothetical protein
MEAMDSKDRRLWKKAMDEEMEALDNIEDWDIVEFSTRINPIGVVYLFHYRGFQTSQLPFYTWIFT